jgi:hypothetical protein
MAMPSKPPNARAAQSAAASVRYDAERAKRQAKVWHNSARWLRKRDAQLRDEPLCRMCKRDGTVTVATICDHVIPHRGDYDLFWNGETQSLCATHHASEKQREEAASLRTPAGG